MARDPKIRFKTAEEFHDALAPWTDDITHGPASGDTELAREVRWLRPGALFRALAIGFVAAAWVSAIAGAITFAVVTPEHMNPWMPNVLRGAPAVGWLLTTVLGLRAVIKRWRSSPRLIAWSRAAGNALAVGVGTLGVLALAGQSWRSIMANPAEVIPAEGITMLAVSFLFAFLALLLTLGRK
jgi:hypothetical protein